MVSYSHSASKGGATRKGHVKHRPLPSTSASFRAPPENKIQSARLFLSRMTILIYGFFYIQKMLFLSIDVSVITTYRCQMRCKIAFNGIL
jgi:hypothetical protein